MRLEKPLNTGFWDEVVLCISELHCQCAWRQFWFFKGKVNNSSAYLIGDTVPYLAWVRRLVFKWQHHRLWKILVEQDMVNICILKDAEWLLMTQSKLIQDSNQLKTCLHTLWHKQVLDFSVVPQSNGVLIGERQHIFRMVMRWHIFTDRELWQPWIWIRVLCTACVSGWET